MKTTKRILAALYILLIVCMGLATFMEKQRGTSYVASHVYGAWWFSALWALLTAVAVFYFVRRRVRKPSAVALHLSFVVILAGALLTHLTARRGMVHLREGEATDRYLVQAGDDVQERALPFRIALRQFCIRYHEGTQAVADYETRFALLPLRGDTTIGEGLVSMNNIFSYRGIRLYQSSHDPDLRGSILALNSDPWGIPVTYTGYALLFVALVWMLLDPKGQYREVVGGSKTRAWLLLLLLFPPGLPPLASRLHAAPTLPRQTAEQMGRLYINYNDRICPLQTYALDFTKKLCGKSHYGDYTAEQVLAGFVFWGDEWEKEPILKIKGGPLKEALQLPDHCAFATFFNQDLGGYILGPYVRESMAGNHDKFHQDVMKVDDRLMMLMELRQGKPLRVFPYTLHTTAWYAPTDSLPASMEPARRQYIANAFGLLYEYALAGNWEKMDGMLAKMLQYQQRYGGRTLPSPWQTRAERTYNCIPFATILFMANLAMGLLGLLLYVSPAKRKSRRRSPLATHALSLAALLSLLALTCCLALRWIISGTIPMSNGYETMLLMAWLVMLLALLLRRRFPVVLAFGFLLSGFFLLVSHLSQMDPQISHLMPVLASPLLTVHVSVIMMAYALLSLTFLCGLCHLLVPRLVHLTSLSQILLYPALACLGIGIFVGAIWANQSWGAYWTWDPKETWALITLMVYAVPVHQQSLPWLRRPRAYHLYMVLAFLSLLMTYFGVNYFLGGMHSYA